MTLRYTPPTGFTGLDRMRYTIDDGFGGRAEALVVVDVVREPTLTVTSPAPGAELPAGEVVVEVVAQGCALGPSPGDCRIDGTLDGWAIPSVTSTSIPVKTRVDGPHALDLALVRADGTPLDPSVTARASWITVGGDVPGEYDGSVTFADTDQMSRFCRDGYVRVTGDVVLDTSLALDIDALACLEEIGGALIASRTSLRSIELPALRSVGAEILIERNLVDEVRLPGLSTVGAGVSFAAELGLTTLDLGGLVRVGGDLDLSQLGSVIDLELGTLEEVEGELHLSAGALLGLELPALQSVDGGVTITGAAMTRLSAPALVDVGGFTVGCASLATLDLPRLEEVAADLVLSTGLTTLELPTLRTVGGMLSVSGNDRLTTVSVPALDAIGAAAFTDDDRLATIDLTGVKAIGSLWVRDNPVLDAVRLSVTDLDVVIVDGNPRLTELSLPSLQQCTDVVRISDNDALATLELPALADAGSVEIHDNVALAEVALPSLVGAADGIDVRDNLALAELSLPSLVTVGDLELYRNALVDLDITALQDADRIVVIDPPLASLALPALKSVYERISFSVLPALSSLHLPALESCNEVHVSEVPSLGAVSLPAFVDGWVFVTGGSSVVEVSIPVLPEGRVYLQDVPSMTSLDAGALVWGELILERTGLTSLSLVLDSFGDLIVLENAELQTLDVQAADVQLVEVRGNPQLTTVTLDVPTCGGVWVSDNDALELLDLSGVTALSGGPASLSVHHNPSLRTIDLSNAQVGDTYRINVADNDALTSLRLDVLRTIGQLRVQASALGSLVLPALDEVSRPSCVPSCFELDAPSLVTLEAPSLRHAPDLVVVSTVLTQLALPALVAVDRDLHLAGNPSLAVVDLPRLDTVGGELWVTDNPALSSLALPELVDSGRITIEHNDTLVDLGLPEVTRTARLGVLGNPALTSVDLAALTTVGPAGGTGDGDLVIDDNAALASLDGLSALASVEGDLVVRDNPSLPQAAVVAFVKPLVVGGKVVIVGNQP